MKLITSAISHNQHIVSMLVLSKCGNFKFQKCSIYNTTTVSTLTMIAATLIMITTTLMMITTTLMMITATLMMINHNMHDDKPQHA